jgi:lipid II:glycine glycyltransferase (peptidoglycan interpeptide bridge formation enzyme)
MVDNWQNYDVWNSFVKKHPEGRYCHLYNYSQVTQCYGYDVRHICFLKTDSIVALIPVTIIKNLVGGTRWISQPFSEYGGLLIAPDVKPEEILHIILLLRNYLAENNSGGYLEFHSNHGIPADFAQRLFLNRNPQQLAFLHLNQTVDDLWKKTIRYEVRKAVNKARNSGLIIHEECNESIIKDYFYPLYLKSMKRLGVPPHKLEFFLNAYRAFGNDMKIFWANKNSTKISALLGFLCGNRVSLSIIASNSDYWHLRPNDLLHWEFLKYAIENSFSYFDFGSVRYEGQQRFKKKWGCEIIEQNYQFLTANSEQTSIFTYNSSS